MNQNHVKTIQTDVGFYFVTGAVRVHRCETYRTRKMNKIILSISFLPLSMVTRFVITCRKRWIRKIQIANADLGIFVENVSVENVSVDIQTVTHRAL